MNVRNSCCVDFEGVGTLYQLQNVTIFVPIKILHTFQMAAKRR